MTIIIRRKTDGTVESEVYNRTEKISSAKTRGFRKSEPETDLNQFFGKNVSRASLDQDGKIKVPSVNSIVD